nr:PASTA domain-containing protein [Micromonospora sp. DSM 115978]
MTEALPGGPGRSEPGWRPRLPLVAGILAGFVLLATIGALSGWLLAGGAGGEGERRDGDLAASSPTPTTPTPRSTTRRPDPPVETPNQPTALPEIPGGKFELPDLVGRDFKQARAELRRSGLGWQLIFGSAGDDPAIARTDPRPGTAVGSGTTVKLYVVGAAPVVAVPDLEGLACARAAARLIDEGLYPRYPTGKVGLVVRQDPGAGTEARWNGEVNLYCGGDQESPAASPVG